MKDCFKKCLDKCKKKQSIRIFEMAFMTLCENTTLICGDLKTKQKLDGIWDAAEAAGLAQDQIIFAGQAAHTSPLHVLSKNGNNAVLEWYLEKRSSQENDDQVVPEIDLLDGKGYTALFYACWKGHKGKVTPEEIDQVKKNRFTCACLLIDEGANVNFTTQKLGKTPLHWAAYHGDVDLVRTLLRKGAVQQKSNQGYAPVDIAGFCSNGKVIEVITHELALRIHKDEILKTKMKEDELDFLDFKSAR